MIYIYDNYVNCVIQFIMLAAYLFWMDPSYICDELKNKMNICSFDLFVLMNIRCVQICL